MRRVPSDFAPKTILVIQLRQIGDVLMTTPALRALRRRYPQARIMYLAEPLPAKVLEGNPVIDEVIIRDPSGGILEPLQTISKIRARRPDLVIDFLANPRATMIAFLSGAKVTLTYADNRRAIFYSHTVRAEGMFSGAQKFSLLRALGVKPDSETMDLDMPVPEAARDKIAQWFALAGLESAPRPLVCLEPFQKWPALTYPPEGFVKICELMREKWGGTVIVCWGPGKEEAARRIVEDAKALLVLAPPTDLHELAALYQRADLWVGVDCGPRHIAAAQGVPTFAVLGPSGDAWTPPGPRHLSVYRDDLECLPCDRRTCIEGHHDCMEKFPPEDVFKKLEEFWRRVERLENTRPLTKSVAKGR